MKGYFRDTCTTERCRNRIRLKQGRSECALINARESLKNELNRVDIIRQLRYFRLALAELLPENRVKDLTKRAKYIDVFALSDAQQ